MKIVIAPDSFKESLSAAEVASALEQGIRRVLPDSECVKVPIADGGEGTVSALVAATGGRIVHKRVHDPRGRLVRAMYGISADGRTAIIEMAAASGLTLVPRKLRNPEKTTSYGTGELLAAALAKGARDIILGLGGSATNDGGAGMAQALGVVFLDREGKVINDCLTGGGLSRIASIDMSRRNPALCRARVLAACDVNNRLVGRRGASAIFGPQKGATPEQVGRLDAGLLHLGKLIEAVTGIPVLRIVSGGAAGGLGAGVVAFAGGEIRSGIDVVMECVDMEKVLDGADLVITGEGRIDSQTLYGKAPAGVARIARRLGVPVVAVGGALADDAHGVFKRGVDALEGAVARDMTLVEALALARKNLRSAGERIARWIVLGSRINMKLNL